MAITTTDMEMSPCDVTFNSVNIGGTLGNVAISVKYNKGEIKADQLGSWILDRVINGGEVKVTTEFTEIKNKAALAEVLPNFTYDSGEDTLLMTTNITTRDSASAALLKLHPISAGAGTAEDHHFFKAVPSEETEIIYGPEEQVKVKIVWNIYPDLSTTPPQVYRYGTPTP